MNFILFFRDKINPQQFSQTCLLISALWFLVIYPSINWLCPDKLPIEMRPGSHCDFYQYYVGAVVVRHGIWNSLYPIPKQDVYNAPNHFMPKFRTFLFNPAIASTDTAFYPPLNLREASGCAPDLLVYFPEIKDGYWYYINPPPTALLLWPLSLVTFDCAANRLWPTICIWSLFAVSFFSSRIHRLVCQSESYTEGLIILSCVTFSYRERTTIPDGNVTPILSALIAISIYALIQKRLLAFSCAYIPLLLFKTIGLTWLPLLLINRVFWRSLVYLVVISLLLNGMVMELAGVGVYRRFFELAPKITIPAGIGIVPNLLHLYGFYPRTLYLIINLTCLALLYSGYWKKAIKGFFKNPVDDSPLLLVALLAGTMALYCLFNFSVWFPYCANYLFFPFVGWIVQEGYLASGRWRRFILGGTCVAFLVLSTEWIADGSMFHLFGPSGVGWYHECIFQFFCILIVPVFFLLVALRRLLFNYAGDDKL